MSDRFTPSLPADSLPADPLAAAQARVRAVRRWRALYKLVLLAALTALCWAVLNLILTRRNTIAAPSLQQRVDRLEQTDPSPARRPVFDPAQVPSDELTPPAPDEPLVPDITLSS